MRIPPWVDRGWRPEAVAFLAGALLPFAFAPIGLFPLAILAPALLFALWLDASPRQAARRGFAFGLGLFGVGVSWVYVAVHVFGESPAAVALLLTVLFVVVLSFYPALAGYLAARLPARSEARRLLLLFPALWVGFEWLRGWLFTGFPWLNLGYSQIDGPLMGLAPLLGVYGVGLAVAVTAGALVWVWRQPRGYRLALPLAAGIWVAALAVTPIEWVAPVGEPVRVSLVQGNQPQIGKWDPDAVRQRLDVYAEASLRWMADSDLIVWPENAVTVFAHQVPEYFDQLEQAAQASATELLLGVPRLDDNGRDYFTTMMSLGSERAFYSKHHLVPFGEYLPFEERLRGLISFFDMPMSSFSRGPRVQPPLTLGRVQAAVSICYEDAFGEAIIRTVPDADLLINGSNNAWYGNSFAPHQHLQIARMRALETGRPLLRATTNGISALVDHRGRILHRSPQFETYVVHGTVQPMRGETLYVRLGNIPLLILLAGMFALALRLTPINSGKQP